MKAPLARLAAKWLHPYYLEQVVLFVTARCNMSCSFCFYYEEIDSASRSKELTLEEIRAVARTMRPFYLLNIGGGEPFVRDDVDEICGAFIEHAGVRQVIIPTNGWYAERTVAAVERLVSRRPEAAVAVLLSIDGIGEEHDRIRGLPGSYDRALETYRGLAEVRRRRPNLSLLTNTTLNRDNESRIVEILAHLDREHEFDDHVMGLVRFKSRDAGALRVSLDRYASGVRFLLDRKMRRTRYRGIPRWLSRAFLVKDVVRYKAILDLAARGRMTAPCGAGSLALTISEEGVVSECEIRRTEIGRLRETGFDFDRLYFSRRREEVARAQRDEKCACTYECYLPFSILLHPPALPALLKASLMTLLRKDPESWVFAS
jgi:MoaA/NifB/PqqE/SkfB family radical SAM enzyme